MVIADTSVWVEYFRGGHEPARTALRDLIRAARAVVVGVVLAELLQGCRSAKEANMVVSKLSGLRFLETRFSTWKSAGELSASLRREGLTLPLSDLVIAALAFEHRCEVFTLDPHFEQVPGLTLHRVSRGARPR